MVGKETLRTRKISLRPGDFAKRRAADAKRLAAARKLAETETHKRRMHPLNQEVEKYLNTLVNYRKMLSPTNVSPAQNERSFLDDVLLRSRALVAEPGKLLSIVEGSEALERLIKDAPPDERSFLEEVRLRSRALENTEIDDALHAEYHWVRGGPDLLVLLRHLKLITDVDGIVHRLARNDQYIISNTLAKHFESNHPVASAALFAKYRHPSATTRTRLEKEALEENAHNATMSEKILKAMMSASYYGLLLDKKKLIAMVFVCSFRFDRKSFAYITLNICKEDYYTNERTCYNFMGECIGRVQVSLEMQGFDIAGVSPQAEHLDHYTRKPGTIYTEGISSIMPDFKATGDLEKNSFFRDLKNNSAKAKALYRRP